MKKFAVDVYRSEAITVVIDAENEDHAIEMALNAAVNVSDCDWHPTDYYDAHIYLRDVEIGESGYSIVYTNGVGFLSFE